MYQNLTSYVSLYLIYKCQCHIHRQQYVDVQLCFRVFTLPILGTCKASGFDSNWMISIQFESDGLIQNFWISYTCRRTTNYARCSTKKLQTLHRCSWDLFYVYDFYVARAYTLASTVGAIVHFVWGTRRICKSLVCNNTRKRLHPDLIHDSVRTKISDLQVPTPYFYHVWSLYGVAFHFCVSIMSPCDIGS